MIISLPTDSRKKVSCTPTDIFIHGLRWHKKNVSPRPYTLSAQPYDFERHWLIPNFFVAHFHFWQFHALVSRILLRSNCSKSLIMNSHYTQGIVERHSYRTPPSLSLSHNRFFGTEISNIKTAFSLLPVPDTVCSLDSHLSHFHVLLKIFPKQGDAQTHLHDLEFRMSFFKTIKTGKLDCGKVYFFTMLI